MKVKLSAGCRNILTNILFKFLKRWNGYHCNDKVTPNICHEALELNGMRNCDICLVRSTSFVNLGHTNVLQLKRRQQTKTGSIWAVAPTISVSPHNRKF